MGNYNSVYNMGQKRGNIEPAEMALSCKDFTGEWHDTKITLVCYNWANRMIYYDKSKMMPQPRQCFRKHSICKVNWIDGDAYREWNELPDPWNWSYHSFNSPLSFSSMHGRYL